MKRLAIAMLGLGLLCTHVYAETTENRTQMEETSSVTSVANQNLQTGEAFLAANKNKPGVVTLADGLQYKVIKEGTGGQPTENDIVTVNYAGKLINGTEFDSSYKRGQPATFPVSGLIPGWVEALKLMKVGSTWELYIPPTLAYGEQGAPPAIGPNETLIFKLELLDAKKQP
ncbi:MAG: FKBP-type peptidyl-prolyl cis-trans isomerase [Gammaproteobacteria bacterium]|nr:MAG: FKBP-type peptidyl-prolyl cis-trans isomerase [Gammaproteobacteria bacterium]